ncbi:phosphatidate cytidylyltransferase [Methanoculleus sp. Afa-1]|jgi:dolichol kinase|uniref:Phosphatidate cytidylyltransferase n=1 Tax=Methanoculleus formosensis TaxID=2590886 RepID=A0A9E4ZM83_9EURY|nr:phosphatidate cytidylyltransferase [Methanoculleus sp. Afa-1]MCT8336411.1 phosphatidate cytidylyltransferase [Methanoculleus sp. Afa-1]
MHESLRQIVHLTFGLGIAGFVLLFDRDIVLSVLMLALFVGFILSDAISRGYTIPVVSPIIAGLERRDAVPGKGALFFTLGALFCIVFFTKEIAFVGLVALSLLDSVTTLAGLRFGRTRIYNHKSLEGTLAGFAVTAAALCLLLPPGIALMTAAAAAIAELVSPVDDNLVVPVVACLALTLLL